MAIFFAAVHEKFLSNNQQPCQHQSPPKAKGGSVTLTVDYFLSTWKISDMNHTVPPSEDDCWLNNWHPLCNNLHTLKGSVCDGPSGGLRELHHASTSLSPPDDWKGCSSRNLSSSRVAEVGSLSANAKMATKVFVRCVFAIFATNASFLHLVFAIYFSIICNIYHM